MTIDATIAVNAKVTNAQNTMPLSAKIENKCVGAQRRAELYAIRRHD